MPRRREIQKRPVHPDPKYGDKLVTSFVNAMMRALRFIQTFVKRVESSFKIPPERVLETSKYLTIAVSPKLYSQTQHHPRAAQPGFAGRTLR